MSFGFSVGDFITVYQLVNGIRKSFAQAPEQFKAIDQDLRSLSIVLQDAEVRSDTLSEAQAQRLASLVDGCQALLIELQTALDSCAELEAPAKGHALRRIRKRFTWDPQDARDFRARIATQVSLLGAFETLTVVEAVGKQKHHALLEWVSPIDYNAQHGDLLRRHQPGSRKWLFASPQYRDWKQTGGAILVCPGIPGAGKTITMAMITEALQAETENDADRLVVNVYCSYQHRDQEFVGVLCGLLRAALQRTTNIPAGLMKLYEEYSSQNKDLSRDEALGFIRAILSRSSSTFVLVDALDELSPAIRRSLIWELLELRAKCGINLLLTMRDIPEIQKPFLDRGAAHLEIRASDEDVRQYLKDNLAQLPGFVGRDQNLQSDIIHAIAQASSGMFLLAELHLQGLIDKKTKKAVRLTLEGLATGSKAYEEAYRTAIARIQSQGPDSEALAMQALRIITCARRPLSVEELTTALAIDEEDVFDLDNVPDIDDVVGVCFGLVTVDLETNVVRLVHKSTQEYFDRHKRDVLSNADAVMAQLCVRCASIKTPPSEADALVEEGLAPIRAHSDYVAFSAYARAHWGYHYQVAESGCGSDASLPKGKLGLEGGGTGPPRLGLIDLRGLPDVKGTILAACRQGHQSMLELLLNFSNYDINTRPQTKTSSYVHGLVSEKVRLGPASPVIIVLKSLFKLSSEENEEPLLIEAVLSGHVQVVELLLSRGADPNMLGSHGATALYYAAKMGHVEIVALLMDHGNIQLDALSLDSDCWAPEQWEMPSDSCMVNFSTALQAAARNGQSKCVSLLVERADRTVVDELERSALWYAALRGCYESVSALWEWPDVRAAQRKARAGRLVYYAAVQGGDQVVIDLLAPKEGNVRPHFYDFGARCMVRMLGHYALRAPTPEDSTDCLNDEGICAGFMAATRLGMVEKVTAMLPSVDLPNERVTDKYYTALHLAAVLDDPEMARILSRHKGFDINTTDVLGRTPFHLCIARTALGVLEILSQHPDLNPLALTNTGEGAFEIVPLTESGLEVSQILLRIPGLDVNWSSEDGIPLLAVVCNFELYRRGLHDENLFIWRRQEMEEKMGLQYNFAKLLVEQPTTNVNVRSRWGTPVESALRCFLPGILRLFLEREGKALDLRDAEGCHLLFLVIDRLTGLPARTPVEAWTAQADDEFKLLLHHVGEEVCELEKSGDSILHVASSRGTGAMLRALMEEEWWETLLAKNWEDRERIYALAKDNMRLERSDKEMLASVLQI